MSFDLKGIFNIDGRNAARSVKQLEKDVEKSTENMSSYLESAFSGNLGSKLFGAAFKAAGIGAIATLATSLADKFQEKLKDIRIGSLRTGLDPEVFQRVKNVTESMGSSSDTAARAMEHIAIAQEKIRKGEPEANKLLQTFSALGISLADIDQKNFDQIFFKIAEGMKDSEVTGERLAAIHELLGKSGAELIPSFKKGFNSPGASAGLITDDELRNLELTRKSLQEQEGFWKSIAKWAGMTATAVAFATRSVPIVAKDLFQRGLQVFGGKSLAEQDQEAAEVHRMESMLKNSDEFHAKEKQAKELENNQKQLEERQRRLAQEKKDQEEKKRAEEAAPRLQAELDEKARKNELEAMSPSARKAAVRKQVEDARAALEEAQAQEASNSEVDDPRFHEASLKAALRLQDRQHELFGLEKPKESSDDKIHDALARVGGGFASDNTRTIELLEEIRQSSSKTADQLQELKGDSNPLSGF